MYLFYVAHYCRGRLGTQALQLREFADAALLVVAGYGVWYLTFVVIANAWVACAVAVVLTLPLIAGFVLYLRPQSVTRPET